MKYNFKEYEMQDLTFKGPMRRRYNTYVDEYKGYIIYNYIRGEYSRYSVEDKQDNMFVETDDLDEAKEYIDNVLLKK